MINYFAAESSHLGIVYFANESTFVLNDSVFFNDGAAL